ncbi:MAG: hypothetical protein OER86_05425 [Phycisphaerae bacterium]|nr:hypothetical protein [Phycisphaerae bacterium]
MNRPTVNNTIARWTRIGVLFGARASRCSPDPDRLLLDTARLAPSSARLFSLAITWLSEYDRFIARHRLKRLVLDQLEDSVRPVLGLLLDLAIKNGASPELSRVAKACGQYATPRPLFDIHASSPARRKLARHTACKEAKLRGLWAPDVEIKLDALRPASWIVARNPGYQERAIRRGDLRCTILETLQRDVPDHDLDSESALVKLCAAERPAVSASLDDLEREGYPLRQPNNEDRRSHRIRLHVA